MADTAEKADGGNMLKPGQVIRPHVPENVVSDLVKKLYGLNVTSSKELNSYDDKNFLVKVSPEYVENPNIPTVATDGYVLKVLNSMDSKKTDYVDGQNQMMLFLGSRGFTCPQPVKSRDGQLATLEKIFKEGTDDWEENNIQERPHGLHIVRLLTFVPGTILYEVDYTERLFYQMGNYVGLLDKALQEFSHPAYEDHNTIWSLLSVPKLRDFVYAVKDEGRRKLVNDIIQEFEETVPQHYPSMKKSIIHGDFNEQNIIVRPSGSQDGTYEVAGVIDFGDTQKSYHLFEVALCIMYGMLECKQLNMLDVGGHVLAGYTAHMALTDTEIGLLKVCVAARYCQSLAMGEYTYWEVDPGNEYLLTTARNGWRQLAELWDIPAEQLVSRWNNVMDTYRHKT